MTTDLSSDLAVVIQDVAARGEEAVADLARMISVDTTFPLGKGYPAFSDLMDELLARLALSTRQVDVPEKL
ncbi:hypothetical protein [Breoghania sp.]|uniref:hypothetical protein n=1 Tax=Breoghania sp. TaxID=2065378 RepID=UPI0032049A23